MKHALTIIAALACFLAGAFTMRKVDEVAYEKRLSKCDSINDLNQIRYEMECISHYNDTTDVYKQIDIKDNREWDND